MKTNLKYLHLLPEVSLNELDETTPYRAIVVVNADVSSEWRDMVSSWLVNNGCLYMMAWGRDCSLWDDAVDWANLEKFDFNVPDAKSVVTTWHDKEPLKEVFWFSEHCAFHTHVDIKRTIIFDINDHCREDLIVDQFRQAVLEE